MLPGARTPVADPVWITGLGCVSAAGLDAASFWESVRAGRSAVRALRFPWKAGNQVRIGAQLPEGWRPATVPDSQLAQCDIFAMMALQAADEAVEQAGLTGDDLARDDVAVIVGSSIGGAVTVDMSSHQVYERRQRRLDPLTVPKVMGNAAASQISIRYGTTGPSFAVSSACASSAQAIGLGMTLVRAGVVRRALVGGSESLLSPGTMRTWEALRVLSPDACRPFSASRNGLVLGEGAGILVIEAAETAEARGARPLAMLEGYGTSSDGRDLLKPQAEGCGRAMRAALADAGLSGGAIGYVNAHGTGTILNDATETLAVRGALGAAADRIAMSSTKPVHGHTLAAAGALEAIVTVMALRDQFVPPTINYAGPDADCDLDVVPNVGRSVEMRHAMTNSFAFGGVNASLVIGRA
jgi:nodulation protein E